MEVPRSTSHTPRHNLLPSHGQHDSPLLGHGDTSSTQTNPIVLPPISTAMSIPGSRDPIDAPPPLPPPKYIFGNFAENGGGPPPSNYGSLEEERPNYQSRLDGDEGYSSLTSPSSSSHWPATHGLSTQYMHKTNQDYDISVKKKLDLRRNAEERSSPRRGPSTSFNEVSHRRQPLVPGGHMSLPIRPSISDTHVITVSPRSGQFHLGDYRSPSDFGDSERSPFRNRRTNSGSVIDDVASTPGTLVDEGDFPNEEMSGIRHLRLEDSFGRPSGTKRRASSPPTDEPPIHNMGAEILRRQHPSSRGSPTPRLSIPSNRIGSFQTTMAPYRGMQAAVSPGGISPISSESAVGSVYGSPMALPSTRPPPIRSTHQRNMSESRSTAISRKLAETKAGVARLQGFFMCDCCPKKPKKFETRQELSAHEAEKQYECSFCGNRFKNKNEAERHQNSLHVRRHSWSCSALSHFDRAFHESAVRPGEADTCGYCGEEFTRSGITGKTMHATEHDWDLRIRHLQDVHKFRECNAAKKFYRADHFRQHLKHSHAGTSGKWTNMLENACMIEEEPPSQ